MAPLLAARPARAKGLNPELEAAWTALGPAARGWVPHLSPAFPASRPPDGVIHRYALAWRLRPSLADGAEVAAPWAVVETRPGAPARVIPLTPELAPLGIQGVRPLSGEELALAGREAEVDALLSTPPDAAGAALIRAFHCGWARGQGVVAAAILPRHPAFAAWLGCG